MSRHTIQVLTLQDMKECRDNYKTNSAELYRDIFNLCSDIIQEKDTEHCSDITL